MNKIDWSEKSIFRKIIIIMSALQVVAFFALPYARMNSAVGSLNSLANSFGASTGIPNNLTGFAAVKLFLSPFAGEMLGGDASAFYVVLFVLALICPLLVLVLNLFNKGKSGYVVKIITAIIMIADYAFITAVAYGLSTAGYEAYPFGMIFCTLEFAMFIISIIGLVKDGKSSGKAGGSNVKQGKHDGTLTGIRGSYAGAVIPLKSGTAEVIGRDPKSCSVVIKGENVSRRHCSVIYDEKNNSYSVTDYSVNGVYDRRGRKLESGRVNIMAPGDEIHIGATDEIFRLG